MYRIAFFVLVVALLPAGSGAARAGELKVGGTGVATGILLRLNDAFSKSSPGDKLNVISGLGSSGGIQAVAEGAIQFSFSSRDLKAEEKAKGLMIVPSFDSPFIFVTSHPQPPMLTKADVVAIHDGALKTWPDGKPIKPILRNKTESVTSFLNENFEGMPKAMERSRQRSDLPVAATDQDNFDIAEKIEGSFSAGTLVQFLTEKPRLRKITLGGIDASIETMENGSYPLRMRTYIVMKSDRTPIEARFLDFLQSAKAETILRESGAAPVARETKR